MSPAVWTAWLCTAVGVHLVWGFHPVFSRWLQTRAAVPVDGINLLGVCQLIALLVNLVVSSQPAAALYAHCSGSDGWAANGTAKEGASTGSAASLCRHACTRKHALYAAMIGVAYAVRAATNIISSRFTVATNVILIQLAAPFVNGLAAWLILRERVDRSLAYAMVASTIGVTVAVTGQMDTAGIPSVSSDSGEPTPAFSWVDALGMMIQAVPSFQGTFPRIFYIHSVTQFESMGRQ